jgi:hypothetical protein
MRPGARFGDDLPSWKKRLWDEVQGQEREAKDQRESLFFTEFPWLEDHYTKMRNGYIWDRNFPRDQRIVQEGTGVFTAKQAIGWAEVRARERLGE